MQVLFADAVEAAHNAALQDGEEAFGALHTNAVLEIFIGLVIDRLVLGELLAAHPVIGKRGIGVHALTCCPPSPRLELSDLMLFTYGFAQGRFRRSRSPH